MKAQTIIGAIAFIVLLGYGWKLALAVILVLGLPIMFLAHKMGFFKPDAHRNP